jgi:putative IMPACT (imprinted ancient) family translation regulator
MSMTFTTLAGPGEARLRDRASVFLAWAAPAASDEEARAVLASREALHRDASHHGSAWRLRDGTRRANDAGEPAGSTGPPILAAIEGAGLLDTVVVVSRWFGGTRLGVGGLVRAYGGAAAAALAGAPRAQGVEALRVRIAYGYAHTAAVLRALERAGAEAMAHGYAAGAEGVLEATVPREAAAALEAALREGTAGTVGLGERTSVVLYRNAAP